MGSMYLASCTVLEQRQSSKRFNAEDQELQYSTFKQNLFKIC